MFVTRNYPSSSRYVLLCLFPAPALKSPAENSIPEKSLDTSLHTEPFLSKASMP